MKDQLSGDVAGNLQLEIDKEKSNGFCWLASKRNQEF